MTLTDKLQRYAKSARIIGVLILVAVFGYVAYLVYDFYADKVGFTATKAIETYFQALASEDFDTVYEMTARDVLTDIYGRPLTRTEFYDQLELVAGDERFSYTEVTAEEIDSARDTYYFDVTLKTNIGGTERTSQVLLKVFHIDKTWTIVYPFAIMR